MKGECVFWQGWGWAKERTRIRDGCERFSFSPGEKAGMRAGDRLERYGRTNSLTPTLSPRRGLSGRPPGGADAACGVDEG